MFRFEKLSLKQISVISKIINEITYFKIKFIEQKFLRDATNFEETIFFLEEMNLIKTKDNEIIIEKEYRDFFSEYKNSNYRGDIIKKFLINKLLTTDNTYSEYLDEFLGNFDESKIFKAKKSQKIKYSGIRNFLMELGFIKLDIIKGYYKISKEYNNLLIDRNYKRKTSFNKYKKILKEKERISFLAELEIIDYEKNKLKNLDFLVERVEHTSQYDVSAGYDIKSFEDYLDDCNKPITIFIEVKAVSIIDYKFYWTRNEIEKAKYYHKSYYLYLLPVKGNKKFYIENLKKISDPLNKVFMNHKKWECSEELFSFSMIK